MWCDHLGRYADALFLGGTLALFATAKLAHNYSIDKRERAMYKEVCERQGDLNMELDRVSQQLEHIANDSRMAYLALGMSSAMISSMAGNPAYRKKWIEDLQRCAAGDAKGCEVIWGVAAVMNQKKGK